MVKKKITTSKEIEDNLDKFSRVVDMIVSGKIQLTTNKETVIGKLNIIEGQLLKLKHKAIPYRVLVKLIKDELNLNVSEQTLRLYCQKKLGFQKMNKTTALEQIEELVTDKEFK